MGKRNLNLLSLLPLLVFVDPSIAFGIPSTTKNHHSLPALTTTTTMVNFYGHISLRLSSTRRGISEATIRSSSISEKQQQIRPPDPNRLLNTHELDEKVQMLLDWWSNKKSVFCITGAGLSTESGIPDYRGHEGSYHRGHKPVIHQQYMESEYQRQRYWGRSMIGWSKFDSAKPNKGHVALANLERMGYLGVTMEDRPSFYRPEDEDEFYSSSGQQKLAVMTQNVDSLHEQAGSKAVIHLHGRGNIVKCMNCGKRQDRNEYTEELKSMNQEWLETALKGYEQSSDLRPDGDAIVRDVDYGHVHVPNCRHCKEGPMKTDVVFFGDSVPKHRVSLCQEAVDASDGILVVGSSLAVHSAFRHVRAANARGIPVAILNVGETRAETEGLDNILKIEAPAGTTLELCAKELDEEEQYNISQSTGILST